MPQPATYEEWREAAETADQRGRAESWKRDDRSDLYDYKVIRYRYEELVDIRNSGDFARLLYYLNEGLHGNMGGMGAPGLYTTVRLGTKALITDYIDEIVAALTRLADADEHEVPFAEKIPLFRRASDCFGRSALMLSGAGSLGPFHLGVVKALAERDLLPRVISGASAGSVVAAMVGTHGREALLEILTSMDLVNRFAGATDGERGPGRRRITLNDVEATLGTWIPDLTFLEAFELTGRSINISVAPSEPQQRSRLLNASTSPNVFIRDAVLASCAIPGVFPAVTLAAKNARGERQAYVPSRRWVDGSITGDLPARRLSRLYGVNHFITSQTNPAVLWALQDPHANDDLLARGMAIYQSAVREWLRTLYPFVRELVRDIHPLNTYTRMFFSVMTQEYTADINIIPRSRMFNPAHLLATLTPEETRRLIREGERATWPKLEMIRNCTKVSRCLDDILVRLDQQLTLEHTLAN